MLRLTIEGNIYSIPTELKELNLTDAIRVRNITDKHTATGKDQNIHNLNLSDNTCFCLDLLSGLSGIPKVQVEKVNRQELCRLTKNYLLPITWELIYSPYTNTYPENDYFEWNSEVLFYPATEYDLGGEMLELAETSAQEFCEACDMMNADRLMYAPRITATLCRPHNERFDSHAASRRADKMLFIGMDIIANVLGKLNRTLIYIEKEFGIVKSSNTGKEELSASNDPKINWCEFLLLTASCRPTEAEACKKMNLYDFLQLACFKQRTSTTN